MSLFGSPTLEPITTPCARNSASLSASSPTSPSMKYVGPSPGPGPEPRSSPKKEEQLESCPLQDGYVRIQLRFGFVCALFDLKREYSLEKAFARFAQKIEHDLRFLRFHYDHIRLSGSDTPFSLGMSTQQSGDEAEIIEVLLEQFGG